MKKFKKKTVVNETRRVTVYNNVIKKQEKKSIVN